MRRYDDPVEVRRGMVRGAQGPVEGPEQFLWRGRLWKVADVLARWVETGPWWQSAEADAVRGTDEPARADQADQADRADRADRSGEGSTLVAPPAVDLLAEREFWRVEAAAGRHAARDGRGIFDLVFDWADGTWQLARCVD
jgi:hypothetical protein